LQTPPLIYEFGEFKLDQAKGCLLKGADEIKLRPKLHEALLYFLRNPGRLVPKQELIEAVWPGTFVTDDSLVQCVLELRRALGDHEQKLIKTAPRRGYIFAASVLPVSVHQQGQDSCSHVEAGGLNELQGRRYLPVPQTTLVGREQQLAEAAALMVRPAVRLLTMTGSGGSGKTRLALATATAVQEHFPGGVQFIGLASITQAELVKTAIAKALDIQQVAQSSLAKLIAHQLGDAGPYLLLLDNFEQVMPAATLVSEILAACPKLKILATSRESLHIYGEQEFPVTPLAQPAAVELFAQRAAAVRPAFAMNDENAPLIQEICSRLEGLPLAIELAAARTKVLPLGAILERLHSRLRLLTGGALDLPERQQTLRRTIDWSHELLNAAEQRLFRRLSVFSGGWTLEAAEAVCNTRLDLEMDTLEGLSSLVDKNLVQVAAGDDREPRFNMLETIREYAHETLVAHGEEAATRRAHAAYCMVLAEEGNPELAPAERSRWLLQCDVEIDNFRTALDWLFQHHEIEWGLRLCVALFRFWDMREHLAEGRARLETILGLAGKGHTKERARVAQFLGALVTAQGDFPAAKTFLQESLTLYQQIGDQWGIGASLNALAISARDRGDYVCARENFEKSLASWRALSDRLAIARCLHNLANVVKVEGDYSSASAALSEAASIFEELGDRSGAAWSINQLGDIARDKGELKVAHDLYQRAISRFREAEDRWGLARSLTDLGQIDCEQGEHQKARAEYHEALEIFAKLRHRRGMARALEGTACLALARGNALRALRLAGAAAHLRQTIGAPLPPSEQAKLRQTLARAWGSLSEAEAEKAWDEGKTLGLERAIQYSLEEPAPTSPQKPQ
jgi:predicted ATPase/DNA-binding winged helix-turn-helix (wHTH) protein